MWETDLGPLICYYQCPLAGSWSLLVKWTKYTVLSTGNLPSIVVPWYYIVHCT